MGDQSRARLTSFCLWFARHRGSVQQLSLSLGAQHLPDEYNVCLAAAQITAALAACGAAGCPLATLQLEVTNLDLPGSGWVGELRSLRTLAIHRAFDNMELEVDSSLAALTRLESLWISASYEFLDMSPAAHLPRSLTRLHLCGYQADALPQQVGAGWPGSHRMAEARCCQWRFHLPPDMLLAC